MELLPQTESSARQVVSKVSEVTATLCRIAQEEGFDLQQLVPIWVQLPVEETGGMTYLESAGQCILEISNLVDKNKVDLSSHQKMAIKLRLMGRLLLLKADILV